MLLFCPFTPILQILEAKLVNEIFLAKSNASIFSTEPTWLARRCTDSDVTSQAGSVEKTGAVDLAKQKLSSTHYTKII